MNKNLKISGYCTIRNNSVFADGSLLISHEGAYPDLLNYLYKALGINYPKFHKMDTLCKLGFLSSEILLKNKELEKHYKGEEIGIVLMNSSSSLDNDRKHQDTINNKSEYFPSPSVFVYTLPNVVIGELCIRHKIYGEGCFFVAPGFDSHLLFRQTEQLFISDIARCCITGWIETDRNKYESLFFLVEECNETESGIVKFSPDNLEKIYTGKYNGTAC
jgi:hypothetical protein